MMEILLYALPKEETRQYRETLLSISCKTEEDIERVKTAARSVGYHSFRVAYCTEEKPNFLSAVNI